MAYSRFEQIQRRMVINGSRRMLIKLAAASVAGFAPSIMRVKTAPATDKRTDGRACRDGNDCISGVCGDWDVKHDSGRCIDAAQA